MRLTLRNVRPWGETLCDVDIVDGRITSICSATPSCSSSVDSLDGKGACLLPGLHDHHLHLLAMAAREKSLDLSGCQTETDIRTRLSTVPQRQVRAVGYDERVCGLPDVHRLDDWEPSRPMKIQDRTGALWILNTLALSKVVRNDWPKGAERDETGRLTGRFWREDKWLRSALPSMAPDLRGLGVQLARFGLTALTDAGSQNGPPEADFLRGKFPQRLTLMGSEALEEGEGYSRGPLKLLIDERDLQDMDLMSARIRIARQQGRAVAAHCVTDAELVQFLGALGDAGGTCAGDRIEHGGLIPKGFLPAIQAAGLVVVTNPSFIHDRGDRYLETMPEADVADLYPARRLLDYGIGLRAGSDAPYADVDPWAGMRAARDRRTASGRVIGPSERLTARESLGLYCSGHLAVGCPADLVLCDGSLTDVLADLSADRVRLTLIGGKIVYQRA